MLILDEIGQASSKVVSEAVYMLSNGQGKTRARRDGSARNTYRWTLLFLSSGELGLSEKLFEGGYKSKAGQELRLVGIPTEKKLHIPC